MAIWMCGGCPSEVCNDSRRGCETGSFSYEGLVLGRVERNGAHDSDFHAVVWDAAGRTLKLVFYASTASWTYHNGAKVDATPDVVEQALAWYRARWPHKVMRDLRTALPRRGQVVRSLTTRGKNCGVQGTVTWVGIGYNRVTRVGFLVEGEARPRYMDAKRVEVVTEVTMDELVRQAPHEQVTSWGTAYDRAHDIEVPIPA